MSTLKITRASHEHVFGAIGIAVLVLGMFFVSVSERPNSLMGFGGISGVLAGWFILALTYSPVSFKEEILTMIPAGIAIIMAFIVVSVAPDHMKEVRFVSFFLAILGILYVLISILSFFVLKLFFLLCGFFGRIKKTN